MQWASSLGLQVASYWTDSLKLNLVAKNVVSEFLIIPIIFVMFVPVVKNKCVNWSGHRRAGLEKHRAYSSLLCKVLKNISVLASNPKSKVSVSSRENFGRCRSRSRLQLKIISLGLGPQSLVYTPASVHTVVCIK